jgi:hypothetical protein
MGGKFTVKAIEAMKATGVDFHAELTRVSIEK